MKRRFFPQLSAVLFTGLLGCSTPDGTKPERGPEGTIAYLVEVDSSDPGARIEVDNEYIGKTPVVWKVFGDKDGTFHNFAKFDYRVRATPARAGQMQQEKVFKTGRLFTGEDRIPKKIFFDFGGPPEAPRPTKE